MVGELRDKIRKFGGRTGRLRSRQPDLLTPQPRIQLELTRDQLDEILRQWTEPTRNAPREVVFTLGSEPVGVLEVIASRFVDPSTTGGTTPA